MQKRPHEHLVDDDDWRRIEPIIAAHVAPRDERNAHRLEPARRDQIDSAGGAARRQRPLTGNGLNRLAGDRAAQHRRNRRERRIGHTRKLTDGFHNTRVERLAEGWIDGDALGVDGCNENPLGIESQVTRLERR